MTDLEEDLEQLTREPDAPVDEDNFNYHEIRDEVWCWEGDDS